MLTEAWTIGSLDYGAAQVRTGHTLLALLANDELARMVKDISRELDEDPGRGAAEGFRGDHRAIRPRKRRGARGGRASAGVRRRRRRAAPAAARRRTSTRTRSTSPSAPSRERSIPCSAATSRCGRSSTSSLRRRQNNPILVGEAGVGKTAVVEGFALRIAKGDVPPPLRNVTLRTLDLALLQAGAGVKGEFENRLKGLIEEVKNSPTPIILFIDEAHTMIGAGGAAGQNDAANLLKPALARGELRTIAATTWSRVQEVLREGSGARAPLPAREGRGADARTCACQMLRGIVPALEKHHNVRILDDGLDAAVRLSHRYLADRQLPDKAVSVLDTACARLALGQSATPPAIEDAQRRLDDLAVQRACSSARPPSARTTASGSPTIDAASARRPRRS